MSEFTESDEQYDDEPRGLRKQIEDQAAKAREAEARAAAAERELAFAKAGLPLSDPKMGYFVKGYEGDLTPEAIKAAAESAGFLGQPSAPEVPAEELAQHQQAANLAAGASLAPPDENAEYLNAMAQARTKEEVLALMDRFGSVRTSYING